MPPLTAVPTLATFTPGSAPTAGLELLADAAIARRPATGDATGSPLGLGSASLTPTAGPIALGQSPLLARGPFNPAAAISAKVLRKIVDLDFVEMAEVVMDDTTPPTPGRPASHARVPVTNISQWTERFSVMAAAISARFPHKAPELFAYQATIIRAERNYESGRWVAYDRLYRRGALARRDLNWSITDPRLYNLYWPGQAGPKVCNLPRGGPHRPILSLQPQPTVVRVAAPAGGLSDAWQHWTHSTSSSACTGAGHPVGRHLPTFQRGEVPVPPL